MGHADPQPVAARRSALPSPAVRLGWLGVASAALDMAAVYWKTPAIRAGVTTGDLVDVVTPILLLLLYALVLREVSGPPAEVPSGRRRTPLPRLLFALGGFGLLLGHGIHVAANSIDDAIVRAGVPDPLGLVHWWDERVSHVMIHGSKVAIWVGLTALESRRPPSDGGSGSAWLLLGALAYGFVTFTEGVEGNTVALLLPFAVLFLAWSLGRGRPYAPVRLFYTLAAVVAVLLFATWGIAHHGFPEFSQVGLIPQPR